MWIHGSSEQSSARLLVELLPHGTFRLSIAKSAGISVRSVGSRSETRVPDRERSSRGSGEDGLVRNAAAMLTDTERSGPGNFHAR